MGVARFTYYHTHTNYILLESFRPLYLTPSLHHTPTPHSSNTQVIAFSGELLKLPEDLLRQGLHTSEIVSGYQRAYDKTLELLPSLVAKTVENVRDPVQLEAAIKSVLSTKQYGYESFLSQLVAEACLTTMVITAASLFIYSLRLCFAQPYVGRALFGRDRVHSALKEAKEATARTCFGTVRGVPLPRSSGTWALSSAFGFAGGCAAGAC